jgi:hypothetical protein
VCIGSGANRAGRQYFLETIDLLEADLGAMIGRVQRACEFVCREAEDSAAASERITRQTDGLVD